MSTLFVSDIHLCAERPATTRLFLEFLEHRAASAEALYILGDLFEAWLGDDFILPEFRSVTAALKKLTGAGVPVYVMHGNRDFLIGEGFAELTGCRLIPDPKVIDLYGRAALLMHGDTLCTDDLAYQEMRAKLRSLTWIRAFLEKPAEERMAFARELRARSRSETQAKDEYVMDVNGEAVSRILEKFDISLLIHGHTHRPGTHEITVNGRTGQRIVLGDWYETGSVLACDADGCRLEAVS